MNNKSYEAWTRALVECTIIFQLLGEALASLIPLEFLEKLAEYDADELAEMHLAVAEAEKILGIKD